MLLGAADRATRLIERFAGCFTDSRVPDLVEHTVPTLIGQRVFGIALGYEDLLDHDQLRHDPVLAVLAGKTVAKRADCAPLAGKSTLNRLELSRAELSRYHKIGHDVAAIEALLVDLFLDAHSAPPTQIILDLDATDDPLIGHQEGRFFHGYYDSYCYLPLYVFCGRHLLGGQIASRRHRRQRRQRSRRWRGSSPRSASAGPRLRILLRADLRVCSRHPDELVREQRRGLPVRLGAGMPGWPRPSRPSSPRPKRRASKPTSRHAGSRILAGGRVESWGRERRVVAKAEWTQGDANPRFVVTSLGREEHEARHLYEKLYCARGDMENRIKECQLDLYADRTSANTMRANQLRLWFASMAYVLICALRRIGLAHTQFARASCGTIRLKLLNIGALVRTSVRPIKLAMPSAFPISPCTAPPTPP